MLVHGRGGRFVVGGVVGSTLLIIVDLALVATYDSSGSSGPSVRAPARFGLGAPTLIGAPVSLTGSSGVVLAYSRPGCNCATDIRCAMRITASRGVASTIRLSRADSDTGITVSTTSLTDTLAGVCMRGNGARTSFPVSMGTCFHLGTGVIADGNGIMRKARVLSGMISLGGVRLLFSLPPIGLPDRMCAMNGFYS